MTPKEIKGISEDVVTARIGWTQWEKLITEDDTPVVIISLLPNDSNNGFIELRFAAAADDGGTLVGMSGIMRAPFTKVGGVVTIGTVTSEYLNAGSGIMASSDIDIIAGTGTIDIQATGAVSEVEWDITTFINSAYALLIAP